MELSTNNGVILVKVVRSLVLLPSLILKNNLVVKKNDPSHNSTIPPPPTETAVPVQLSI